jgi:hypothetical protein
MSVVETADKLPSFSVTSPLLVQHMSDLSCTCCHDTLAPTWISPTHHLGFQGPAASLARGCLRAPTPCGLHYA